MALAQQDYRDLFNGVVSVPMALGVFDQVNSHEPENPPGKGVNCSVTLGPITPAPSGLASTSLKITFLLRLYSSLEQRPLDPVDPELLVATAVLIGAYSGGFELTGFTNPGVVRDISLLEVSATPRYLIQDGKGFRVMEVTVPIEINDAFDQEA